MLEAVAKDKENFSDREKSTIVRGLDFDQTSGTDSNSKKVSDDIDKKKNNEVIKKGRKLT